MDRPNLSLIGVNNNNEEAFTSLLRRLEPRHSSTSSRYLHLRRKLAKFFAWRRCEDPEGLADEAISRLIKNLNAGQEIHSENAYSYVYAIAANLFKEYLRQKKKDQQIVENWQMPCPPAEAVRDCQRLCLQSLSKEKRQLLEKYYLDEEGREDLALAQSVSLNALRLQVHRIKNELRSCYQNCLKGSQKNGN
jgi:DNA-directed RNA polymerase specialized sigma24 family protein